MIFGITGRIASGKGIVAQYFQQQGFNYFTLSNIVREEAVRRKLSITREQMQILGNEMREKEGADYWMRTLHETNDFSEDGVIDGIRNPAEIIYLRGVTKHHICSVDAHSWIRYKRVLLRNKSSDPKTFSEFIAFDSKDYGIGEPSWGQQVKLCMEMADSHYSNNSRMEDFTNKISKLYSELKQ